MKWLQFVLCLALLSSAHGQVSFSNPTNYAAGGSVSTIVAADFNHDGKVDLIVVNPGEDAFSFLQGVGDGTFLAPVSFSMRSAAGALPGEIVATDFNGDGNMDVAITHPTSTAAGFGNTVTVHLGDGTGHFTTPGTVFTTGGTDTGIVAGDFNEDGKIDLAIGACDQQAIFIHFGNGDGTFTPGGEFFIGGCGGGSRVFVTAADLNHDGHLDLIAANIASATISVLLGDGKGNFGPPKYFNVGNGPAAILVGDFNKDGNLDLAVANLNDNSVTILFGDGNGSFAPGGTFSVGNGPADIQADFFDGTGNLDLLTTNSRSNNTTLLQGQPSGTFSGQFNLAIGTSPAAAAVADFNGDGRPDFAATNAGSQNISVFLNTTPSHAGANSVLLVGGEPALNASYTNTAEVYDLATNTWFPTQNVVPNAPPMNGGGGGLCASNAVTLGNGKVLLAGGGCSDAGITTNAASLYDPGTNQWTATAPMTFGRDQFGMVTLSNGNAIAIAGCAGGCSGPNALGQFLGSIGASTEIYDAQASSWTTAASLHVIHGNFALNQEFQGAVRLMDGRVLACGGSDGFVTVIAMCEIFDPVANTWTITGSLPQACEGETCPLVPLSNGNVLSIMPDGLESAVFNPVQGTWQGSGSLVTRQVGGTLTPLSNGLILLSGGLSDGINPTNNAQLYDATSGLWRLTTSMNVSRNRHAAVLLANGSVLAAGGQETQATFASSAEIYHPGSETWTLTASMSLPRFAPNVAALVTRVSTQGSPQATSVNEVSSIDPSVYGQAVSFTASVSPASGSGTPTGTISFSDGQSALGTIPLSNGQATFSTASLPAAVHLITAVYSGDSKFSASTSAVLSQTVNQASLLITAVNASRPYGSANPSFSFTTTGLVNGDTLATIGVAPVCSTTATSGSPVGSYPITCSGPSATANYSITYQQGTLNITPVPLAITANNAIKILDAPSPALTATYSGFVNGDTPSSLAGTLSCTSAATTTSPVGSYPINCSGQSSNNYVIAYVAGTLNIVYASGGVCDGDLGHQILSPINADGSSVYNQGRTVPAKFRVCDANGVSIGTAGVVSSFYLTQILTGTASTTVQEIVNTNNPDTAFRWDPTNMQWIFNITTQNLSAGSTYIYTITLNDGSSIVFQYGLR
jgi:hypothetical protein